MSLPSDAASEAHSPGVVETVDSSSYSSSSQSTSRVFARFLVGKRELELRSPSHAVSLSTSRICP